MDETSTDLQAFLDAADTPEVSRRVCPRPSLVAERDRLRREVDLFDADEDGEKPKGRMGAKSPEAKARKALAEVEAQIDSSSLLFRFAPLRGSTLKAARDAIAEAGVDPNDAEASLPYVHAAQCLEPAGMTAEKFAALREKWCIPYYDDNISDPAREASRIGVGDPF